MGGWDVEYLRVPALSGHMPLQWRHNGRGSVSNHQPHHCLLNRLFRRRSKKYQSSASMVFVRGIHRWPVKSPHKWPVTQKMFSFDDVIMVSIIVSYPTVIQGVFWNIPKPHTHIYLEYFTRISLINNSQKKHYIHQPIIHQLNLNTQIIRFSHINYLEWHRRDDGGVIYARQ